MMSGTSLDGLDIALIRFTKNELWSFEIEQSQTIPYSSDWQSKLRYREQITANELTELSHDYGNYLSDQVNQFITNFGIDKKEVDLIASHGQTIYHKPEESYTLQIGNGPEIFQGTEITTVCDFRVQDVELGGQGAPLVPIGDKLLFNGYDACINLGGFSNISFEKQKRRIAFDICPVNYVMNNLALKLGKAYDKGGKIAASGSLLPKLLADLNNLEYYYQAHPKTLGAEWVEEFINPLINQGEFAIADVLRTFSEHCAFQLVRVLDEHKLSNVLITGGGAYNDFLIDQIRNISTARIHLPSREIIEFKEALIFGLMGLLRVRSEVNVLATVTGAAKDHSSGKIYA